MKSRNILQYATVFTAEFFASFFCVFIGCMADVDNAPNYTPTLLTSSLGWGMAVMIGLNSFSAVSGGFMSPLITLAVFVHNILDLTVRKYLKKIKFLLKYPQTALIYFAGQMIGGFIGYATLRLIIPNDYLSNPDQFCVLQPKLPLPSSFLLEITVCFIFITFLSAVLDARNKHLHGKQKK